MRTVGLIVEYNPFHNGHLYHLQQSVKITEANAVVAVMSGHFLQRGEPALADKWTRTEMALRGGCDLVLELPVAYSAQAAEWFAYGAVATLDATGVVDALCFGSEGGDLAPMRRVARELASESPPFASLLADKLADGVSYPSAYGAAVKAYMSAKGDADAAAFAFDQPNNTLGLHYLLALERLVSPMTPYTIKREKAGYSQTDITDTQIASATAIRKLILEQGSPDAAAPFIPFTTLDLLAGSSRAEARVSWRLYERSLFHKLLSEPAEMLAAYHEVTEGLEHRIKNALPSLPALTFEALLEALKTKRYTRTKLQRALLAILLGHRKTDMTRERLTTGVEYIRVLGFTPKGRELLKRMRKDARLPVLLSAADARSASRYLQMDVEATSVYALAEPNTDAKMLFRDYYGKPVMLER
ncbi:nucleotidyltransferase [Paenibacillus methanolicus]|uniref:tRNA(Met) cytidine acetate ligase n=1 Tax=Paenibacillus methanolicus TaxID=582686 RepID=A0A5S5CE84_9BACL|nr:nucleotidyltransferase [Paenibacillus methanolicus]TYP77695.1 putative nucleotidyltransferase [Paenibacillus methanolicus]